MSHCTVIFNYCSTLRTCCYVHTNHNYIFSPIFLEFFTYGCNHVALDETQYGLWSAVHAEGAPRMSHKRVRKNTDVNRNFRVGLEICIRVA